MSYAAPHHIDSTDFFTLFCISFSVDSFPLLFRYPDIRWYWFLPLHLLAYLKYSYLGMAIQNLLCLTFGITRFVIIASSDIEGEKFEFE